MAALVMGISSCSAATHPDPGRHDQPQHWMLDIKDWALGEELRGPSSGRPEVGLLVMSSSGENPRQMTDCSIPIQDSLPTGARPGEHFFIIDGQLYIGLAKPGAAPSRIAVTPTNLQFSQLLDVSRANGPIKLLAQVMQGEMEVLWEFEIQALRAHGEPASWKSHYRDFHAFRRMFDAVRCDSDGHNCIITFWDGNKIIVNAEVDGPLGPRIRLFDMDGCEGVVRGWWSRENAGMIYLLASCKKMCPQTLP